MKKSERWKFDPAPGVDQDHATEPEFGRSAPAPPGTGAAIRRGEVQHQIKGFRRGFSGDSDPLNVTRVAGARPNKRSKLPNAGRAPSLLGFVAHAVRRARLVVP